VFNPVRLLDSPIIDASTCASIGDNIQGPSLIRVPDWAPNKLGNYYLYFADHKGTYIRLAYADDLKGPWKIHKPGSLQLKDSYFLQETPPTDEDRLSRARARAQNFPHDVLLDMNIPHIASPDVHIDQVGKKFIMYFHGLNAFGVQVSRAAISNDGIHFQANPEVLGLSYMRAFQHQAMTYVMSMPGQFYRSQDGLSNFETGPRLFEPNMRHCALLVRGDSLLVFWSRVGDTPERIMLSTIDLSADWQDWQESDPVDIIKPERDWEGAGEPMQPSQRSVAYHKVNQLRDPAIFVEDERIYLLYAVAGESGIAIAELTPL